MPLQPAGCWVRGAAALGCDGGGVQCVGDTDCDCDGIGEMSVVVWGRDGDVVMCTPSKAASSMHQVPPLFVRKPTISLHLISHSSSSSSKLRR